MRSRRKQEQLSWVTESALVPFWALDTEKSELGLGCGRAATRPRSLPPEPHKLKLLHFAFYRELPLSEPRVHLSYAPASDSWHLMQKWLERA
jgi:hypothetical protein